MSLLSVDDLHVHFRLEQGALAAVSGVGFDLERGETLGLVGESGCGKSTAAYACMGLLPGSALIPQGSIRFDGQELVGAKDKVLQSLRGRRLAMVFQDAMTALNPYLTVEAQLTGPMRRHLGVDRTEARKRAIALLERVGIPDPEQRMKRHPHEFSGGQRQRLLISLALSCEPELLICDEPTTALDVTIQAQVLDLLKDLQQERELALLFISHDLGVVSQLCERLIVLYAGRMAESGPTADVLAAPRHPYTKGLLGSVPDLSGERGADLATIPGLPPKLVTPVPPGCPFAPRCPEAGADCATAPPRCGSAANWAACHRLSDALPEQAP